MKKILVLSNIILLLVVCLQHWQSIDSQKIQDYFAHNSDYWHTKYHETRKELSFYQNKYQEGNK